jgi:hypothetical protein
MIFSQSTRLKIFLCNHRHAEVRGRQSKDTELAGYSKVALVGLDHQR